MEDYIGLWGLYPWFLEDGEELIHENDLDEIKRLQPYGKVFYCSDANLDFITLKYKELAYRVKPNLFKVIGNPSFTFGEMIRLSNNPEIKGVITDIHWHHKDNIELYYIMVNGKRKTSRYYPKDLMKES
jgi:hypothetical protein